MRQEKSSRENGSALVMTLIILTMVLTFSAAFTVTSLVGLRAMTEGETAMRAYYLADTGCQVGIAKVRASGGTMSKTTLNETIDQGTATVVIDPKSADLYAITSTGTFESRQRTVEAYVLFTGGFSVGGAVPFTFSTTTTYTGTNGPLVNLPIQVDATAKISGKDHDINGVLKADQSKATYALTTNPVGGRPFAQSGTGIVEGVPQAYNNNAASQQATMTTLINNVKTNADVTYTNSQTLSTAQSIGTAAIPKSVYVDLKTNGKLTLKDSFSGYGTLVVTVSGAQMPGGSPLNMTQFAKWTGLVVLQFTGVEADFEATSNPAIHLQNDTKIIGGASIFFANNDVEMTAASKLIGVKNNAQLLHSSSVVSTAPDVGVGGPKTAELASYRKL